MTWQPPEGDRPPDPNAPADPAVPEPDAETARVPLEDTPAPAPKTPEPAAPDAPPTPGLISAAPVGWAGPEQGTPASSAGDGPPVAWAAPVAAAPATVTEGWVIAGVFSRLVAWFIDGFFFAALSLAVYGALGVFNEGSNASVAVLAGVALAVLDGIYFVGLWRSSWQATLGMRLLRLRILGANDAAPLSLNSALLRWIALSGAVTIFALVPGIGGLVGLIALVWSLILLITTQTDRLHQGLHDKWAGSVVVQPAPGGSGAAVVGCLVLVFLLLALPFVVLGLAGDQLREILSQVGNSI
jgi:uncharacterized RDD family membrane protein YckC